MELDLAISNGSTMPETLREPRGTDAAANSADSERRLIERACSEPAAFANLYRLHAPAIANYLQRRTADAHVAEDLLSETFLAAMKALPRFTHNGTPLRFWLYRLATNSVNRWVRTRMRTLKRERRVAIAPDAIAVAPTVAPHEAASEATAAMMTISPRLQTVLALHVIEQLTIEQISQVLGCRAGTVKSRLFRAREALRCELLRRRSADDCHSETKGQA